MCVCVCVCVYIVLLDVEHYTTLAKVSIDKRVLLSLSLLPHAVLKCW